jgi:hypothetical protein
MALRIALDQIHNPSDLWKSCAISSTNTKVSISPIPPRSTRPLPPNLSDPKIIQEVVLPPISVSKFTNSNASASPSSTVVVEAIQVTLDAKWTADIRVADLRKTVTATACIREKELHGWFSMDSVLYFFTGTLNTLVRKCILTCYSSQGLKYPDIRGDLQVSAGRYAIQAQSADIAMSLTTDPETITDIDINSTLSGNYIGFYEKPPHSFEFRAEFLALKNGIVTGTGAEDNRQFTLFGLVDESENKFFFVRIKGNDLAYYTGDAQLQTEIFFQGKWHVARSTGGLVIIKCMQ